jgi:hypothetical protein
MKPHSDQTAEEKLAAAFETANLHLESAAHLSCPIEMEVGPEFVAEAW